MSNFLIDEDTDLVAAEFVLGTLDSEERANAQSLLRKDHGFIAMVRIWERRFGELHLMVEPVEPGAKIWERIKANIPAVAPTEPAADGKPPTEGSPGMFPEATSSPADVPGPADVPTSGETPKPQDVPASEAAPKPDEGPASGVTATIEADRLSVTAADAVVPAPEGTPAAAEAQPVPPAKAELPAPPPLPPPPLEVPDKLPEQDRRPARAPDVSRAVIRSRGRWRAFAVCMTLLVIALAALVAAWRFAPARLPARMRPAELLKSLGIQTVSTSAPAAKPAPPQPQFDE
jgi:anti-sigma-K factor RskA